MSMTNVIEATSTLIVLNVTVIGDPYLVKYLYLTLYWEHIGEGVFEYF